MQRQWEIIEFWVFAAGLGKSWQVGSDRILEFRVLAAGLGKSRHMGGDRKSWCTEPIPTALVRTLPVQALCGERLLSDAKRPGSQLSSQLLASQPAH